MVMSKNHCRRPILKSSDRNFPGVNCGSVQRSKKEVLTAHDAVLVIQKNDTEYLSHPAAQVMLQKQPGLAGTGKHVRSLQLLQSPAASELYRRLQQGILGITYTLKGQQTVRVCSHQTCQSTKLLE
jgi:hypothetical protein